MNNICDVGHAQSIYAQQLSNDNNISFLKIFELIMDVCSRQYIAIVMIGKYFTSKK